MAEIMYSFLLMPIAQCHLTLPQGATK